MPAKTSFYDYEQIQHQAHDFARRYRRTAYRERIFLTLTAVVLIIGALAFSAEVLIGGAMMAGSFGLYKFAGTIGRSISNWWNRRKLKVDNVEPVNPDAQELRLMSTALSPTASLDFADNTLKHAADRKWRKAGYYKSNSITDSTDPADYHYDDIKLEKQLYRYKMYQAGYGAALTQDETFLRSMLHERADNRDKKIALLRVIEGKCFSTDDPASLVYKFGASRDDGNFYVAGAKVSITTSLGQALLQANETQKFMTRPEGISDIDFLNKQLLPCLLDLDNMVNTLPHIKNNHSGPQAYNIALTTTLKVETDYITQRLARLNEKNDPAKRDALDETYHTKLRAGG